MSGSTRTNTESTQVHVSIEDKEKDDTSRVRISGRAPTHLGDQGDHVSAHQLIINAAHTVVSGSSWEEATIKAFHLLDCLHSKIENDINNINLKLYNYDLKGLKPSDSELKDGLLLVDRNDEFILILNDIKERINKYTTESQGNFDFLQIIDDLFISAAKDESFIKKYSQEDKEKSFENIKTQMKKDFEEGIAVKNNKNLEKDIIKAITQYLTIRNKMPYTTFPTEGNVKQPQGEGSRVKQAAKQLRVLEEDMREESQSSILSEDSCKSYVTRITENMFKLFWHPRIPKKVLIDLEKLSGRDLWSQVMAEKNYSLGAKPRDNNLETLYEVVANHIDLVLTCHPFFTFNYNFVSQITQNFVELVAKKGSINGVPMNWGMSLKETKLFYDTIMTKLKVDHRRDEFINEQDWANSNASTPDLTPPINTTPVTQQSPNTSGILSGLSTPPNASFSLARLINANTATPLTALSDDSYRDDDTESLDSSKSEELELRVTRSSQNISASEQLKNSINKFSSKK